MLALPRNADSSPRTEPWTLARTLDEIRQRRLVLVDTSHGLRVRHQHCHDVPGLQEALDAYAEPLRLWLHLGGPEARIPAPWTGTGWDAATRLFAAWFGLRFAMPGQPVALHPGETVTDWVRYRASVMDRLALGSGAPGADRLRTELATLYVRFGRQEAVSATRVLPLAA